MGDLQAVRRSMDQLCEITRSEANNYNETRDHVVLESLEHHLELLYRHVIVLPDADDSTVSSAAADPGGGHSGHVPPPPPPPFINKFITFRAAFYNIAARLRCLLISARMNSTTVLYPGPPDTRSYFPPPRPSYRARNQQHPPPP